MGFLCLDRVFLHRDKVWPRQGILGHDRVLYCPDRVWGKAKRVYVVAENLMSRHTSYSGKKKKKKKKKGPLRIGAS